MSNDKLSKHGYLGSPPDSSSRRPPRGTPEREKPCGHEHTPPPPARTLTHTHTHSSLYQCRKWLIMAGLCEACFLPGLTRQQATPFRFHLAAYRGLKASRGAAEPTCHIAALCQVSPLIRPSNSSILHTEIECV